VTSAIMGGHSSKFSTVGRSAPHSDGLANANDIALQSKHCHVLVLKYCLDIQSYMNFRPILCSALDGTSKIQKPFAPAALPLIQCDGLQTGMEQALVILALRDVTHHSLHGGLSPTVNAS